MKELTKEMRQYIGKELFNRKEMVYIPEEPDEHAKVNPNIVFGLIANLDAYGYTLSSDAVDKLLELKEEKVIEIYEDLIRNAKEAKDIENPQPLFKNFPESCRQIDAETLSNTRFATYFTQFIDYFLGTDLTEKIEWDGAVREREKAKDHPLRILTAGKETDFVQISKNLLNGRMALSEDDKSLVSFSIDTFGSKEVIPEKIPYKDNEIWIIKKAMRGQAEYDIQFSTFKDFMKLSSELSGGIDYSRYHNLNKAVFNKAHYMAKTFLDDAKKHIIKEYPDIRQYEAEAKAWKEFEQKFKSVIKKDCEPELKKHPAIAPIPNEERKALLKALEKIAMTPVFLDSIMNKDNRRNFENLFGYGKKDGLWHLNTNRGIKKYPNIRKSYDITQGQYSHLSKAEQALTRGDSVKAAKEYMAAGPGYVIRGIVNLLDKADEKDKDDVMKVMEQAAKRTKPAVLLQLMASVRNDHPISISFPGGDSSRANLTEKKHILNEKDRERVISVCENSIKKAMSVTKSEAKVYIDPALKSCPVPFAGKNITGENRSCEKGTRLPSDPEKDTVRFFCYKKSPSGRSGFYDLSAVLLDDKFNLTAQCSWTNLKTTVNGHTIAVHSGDNSRSDIGCTEFIDFSKSALKEAVEEAKEDQKVFGNTRYIAVGVHAWNGIVFDNMEKVTFGVMDRNDPGSDRISEDDLDRLTAAGCKIYNLNNGHAAYYYHIPDEFLSVVKDYKPELAFDPATVVRKFDVKGESRVKIAMMYDIQEDRYIVADLDATKTPEYCFQRAGKHQNLAESLVPRELIRSEKMPMVEDYVGETARSAFAVTEIPYQKPTLYDLFRLWAEGNEKVEIVENKEKADTVFAVDRPMEEDDKRYVTPFDKDVIAAEFLTPTEKEPEAKEIDHEEKAIEPIKEKVQDAIDKYNEIKNNNRIVDYDDIDVMEKKLNKIKSAKKDTVKILRDILKDLPEEDRETIKKELDPDISKAIEKEEKFHHTWNVVFEH